MSKYSKHTGNGDLRPLATYPLSAFGGISIYHVDGELITTGFDYGNGIQGLKNNFITSNNYGTFLHYTLSENILS